MHPVRALRSSTEVPLSTTLRVGSAHGNFVGTAITFALSPWLVRNQATVGEVILDEGDDPSPLISILTSERAKITDPLVRKLVDGIIAAQRKEIAEM